MSLLDHQGSDLGREHLESTQLLMITGLGGEKWFQDKFVVLKPETELIASVLKHDKNTQNSKG